MGSLEEVEEIFGEPSVEYSGSHSGDTERRRFVFRLHAVDSSHLAVHVTDFRSNTWESLCSLLHLEDMRDEIGIGGSWSEFMDYFMASFKSPDVKLVLHGDSTSDTGSAYAKLVAQKRKGMPLISISLKKLTDPDAREAIAKLSLQLFQAYKNTRELCTKERDCSSQLTNVISAEQEKSESIKSQLGQCSKRQKLEGVSSSDDAGARAPSNNGLQSPGKQAARDNVSTKVTSRVVPAYRRARVRGALLQDTEDTEDNKQ